MSVERPRIVSTFRDPHAAMDIARLALDGTLARIGFWEAAAANALSWEPLRRRPTRSQACPCEAARRSRATPPRDSMVVCIKCFRR